MPARLYGNLGAEEWPTDRPSAARPERRAAVARTVGLWSMLFGRGCGFLEQELEPEWAASLGLRPDTAAWGWLDVDGGVPWLSTPAAERALASLDLAYEAPPAAVVRKVHDKAFAMAVARASRLMPKELDPLIDVLTADELAADDISARLWERAHGWPEWTAGTMLIKPRWGGSGRGFRSSSSPIRLSDMARRSGAVFEPFLHRGLDLSTQLHVGRKGDVTVLGTTRMRFGRLGGPAGNRGVIDRDSRIHAGTPYDREVAEAAVTVARAAAAEGFFGPCGVDAFTWSEQPGDDGCQHLRPVVELNARFTTGTVAVGLVERALAAGLVAPPGVWWLGLGSKPERREAAARAPGVTALVLGDRADAGLLCFARDEETLAQMSV